MISFFYQNVDSIDQLNYTQIQIKSLQQYKQKRLPI